MVSKLCIHMSLLEASSRSQQHIWLVITWSIFTFSTTHMTFSTTHEYDIHNKTWVCTTKHVWHAQQNMGVTCTTKHGCDMRNKTWVWHAQRNMCDMHNKTCVWHAQQTWVWHAQQNMGVTCTTKHVWHAQQNSPGACWGHQQRWPFACLEEARIPHACACPFCHQRFPAQQSALTQFKILSLYSWHEFGYDKLECLHVIAEVGEQNSCLIRMITPTHKSTLSQAG